MDLAPADGSPLIDAGVAIPNINEDYEGDAPDIGPYEKGRPKPHYGPRTAPPREMLLKEEEGVDAGSAPEPLGEPVLRVNCGAVIAYLDPAGNRWAADKKYESGSWGWIGKSGDVMRRGKVSGTPLQHVLLRERYGMEKYLFELENGRYALRLHFNEAFRKNAGERVFSISANGKTVLGNLDVFQAAGGRNKALTREFEVELGDGQLTLEFSALRDNPMLSGIEIFRRRN